MRIHEDDWQYKMQGTGLSDISLESERMSCGSLVGVLKERAMHKP